MKTDTIVDAYKESFHIDVRHFFKDLATIQLYKCLDTDYQFYFPFDILGDAKFYEHFQQYDWYYMDWKWEHETARRLIEKSSDVLEIGCGKGSFVERLTRENINCVGLELNQDTVENGRVQGLKILNESIWEHAKNNSERYDVVCSFQVLEHIADVKKFLKTSLDVLKFRGKLIISVPNNDSFLCRDRFNILNWPPHHMGLWHERTFRKLEDLFRVKLCKIYIEPLQSYHYDYYVGVTLEYIKNKFASFGCLKDRITKPLLTKFVHKYPFLVKGFTMLGVYTKL